MKQTSKKLAYGLGVLGVAAGLIAGGVAGAVLFPKEVTVTEYQDVVVEKEVIKEVPVNVTVEKIVEVEDTEVLSAVCDRLLYDDLAECKEEVEAEDSAIKLAIAEIESEGFDMLEDKHIFKEENDLEILKMYNDYEDIVVVKSDFDDEEYVFKINAKVNDFARDKKKKVEFRVKVENGEAVLKNVKEV